MPQFDKEHLALEALCANIVKKAFRAKIPNEVFFGFSNMQFEREWPNGEKNQLKKTRDEIMTNEIPKHEFLIKLLNMTTSSNDNEALMAIRQANNLLRSVGWSWDDLIRAKIKIVPNPFTNLPDPRKPSTTSAAPSPPPKPKPPPSTSALRLAFRENAFAGFCYSCGSQVSAQAGHIFMPSDHNPSARSVWAILCPSCNYVGRPPNTISAHPAKHAKVFKPTPADL